MVGQPAEGPSAVRRALASASVVVSAGILLHYAWQWSGRSPMVAILAAVNESTWEHLKLAFWPALLIAPVQWRLYGMPPGWLVASAIRVLLPSLLIVVLFHGYTSVLGTNYLVLDIGTFVLSILAGELAGHAVMYRRTAAGVRALAASALIVAGVAFSMLTVRPPSCFLFQDPHARPHGGGMGAGN